MTGERYIHLAKKKEVSNYQYDQSISSSVTLTAASIFSTNVHRIVKKKNSASRHI